MADACPGCGAYDCTPDTCPAYADWHRREGVPEKGQGPWCHANLDRWWVIAGGPSEALAVIGDLLGTDAFPEDFGWHVTARRVTIRWLSGLEGSEIEECHSEDEGAVKAWRVEIVGR